MDYSHLVFFLGSGVSLPSGMPSVDYITQEVFDMPVVRRAGGFYVPAAEAPELEIEEYRNYADRVREFLKVLRAHADKYLDIPAPTFPTHELVLTNKIGSRRVRRGANYEDLYHLCQQIRQEQKGYTRNSAIRPFSEKIIDEAASILLNDLYESEDKLPYTAGESLRLISSVVRHLLLDRSYKSGSLQLLVDAIKAGEYERVTIITLNHDVLVERYLEDAGIGFEDGFGEADGDFRRYDASVLLTSDSHVRVIKPHGSVDWFLGGLDAESNGGSSGDEEYLRCTEEAGERLRDASGRHYYEAGGLPILLSGYGKESRYGSDIIYDMMVAMATALVNSTSIVVSGYGWRDKGMSNRLLRSLDWDPERKLVLLYADEALKDLFFNSDLHVMNANRYHSAGQLITEQKTFLENTSLDKLNKLLGIA